MVKLIALVALLTALVAVAQATTRLTMTTNVAEVDNQQLGKCAEDLQSQSLRLRSCQQFLIAPFEKPETGEQHAGEESDFKECCQGLNYMEEQCRCEAMAAVAWDIQEMERWAEKGQETESELQKIWAAASSLPNQCHIGGPQQCQFEQPSLIRLF